MATDQEAIKVYLREEDARWLREHTDREGMTIAGLVRKLLREYRALEEAKAAA